MVIPEAALAGIEDEVTFSYWLKKADASPAWYQAIFMGHGVATGRCEIFLSYAPAFSTNMVTTFTAGSDSCEQWASNGTSFSREDPFDYTAWNHYALVKNATLGHLYIYVNGELEKFRGGMYKPIDGCDEFRLGSSLSSEGVDGGFANGSFDDFRVYNRALSHAEILTLAGEATATVALSELEAEDADVNADETVNFEDYSILASEWLVEDLWP